MKLKDGLAGLLSYRFLPTPDELNRYLLTIRGLREGPYEVVADGRLVGVYDAGQLAEGVNLGSATPDPWLPGGPWDAQSTVLRSLTDARTNNVVAHLEAGLYLAQSPNLEAIRKAADELDARIVELQHLAAQPTPYRFVVRRKE